MEEIKFETDDPDALRRKAKRFRRTGKMLVRKGKSSQKAALVKDVELSFARLAQAYDDRADEIVRQRARHGKID